MLTVDKIIERKKTRKRMNIAAILGSAYLLIAFVNWGFVSHNEGHAISRYLLLLGIITNAVLLYYYRQMVKVWKLEDESETEK